MTKTTRLWYVPLADVVETAGRAALLAAEFVDAKMLTRWPPPSCYARK
jgi:hypothetical protein